MKIFRVLTIVAITCITNMYAVQNVHDVYLINESNTALKYPLKIVPVMTSVNDNYNLNPENLRVHGYSMFNGIIPVGQRYKIISTIPDSWDDTLFEWQMYAVVDGKDIPVGRILFGLNPTGKQQYLGIISQTSIENSLEKRRLFDGFQYNYDKTLMSNRPTFMYGGLRYYKVEDEGTFVTPSYNKVSYRLVAVAGPEALNYYKANADRRIWASFTITSAELLKDGEYCSLDSEKHGTFDANNKVCVAKSCSGTKDDYTYSEGTVDIRNNSCNPSYGSSCVKNGLFKGTVDGHKNCILPEGSRCLIDPNPKVWSYQGIIRGGRCVQEGPLVTADYINGMDVHVTVGPQGALAKPGDPCRIKSNGQLGLYQGNPNGYGARCVPR